MGTAFREACFTEESRSGPLLIGDRPRFSTATVAADVHRYQKTWSVPYFPELVNKNVRRFGAMVVDSVAIYQVWPY